MTGLLSEAGILEKQEGLILITAPSIYIINCISLYE
jgi:hypothetical protein